jgi:hypothetical protein
MLGDGDGVFLGLDEPVADGAPIHEAGDGNGAKELEANL